MPPKEKASKKGKTAKEFNEQDQQKLKEEEDAQLKKKQLEDDKLYREQFESEQKKNQEIEEAKRKKSEVKELANLVSSNAAVVKNAKDTRRKKAKWDRYMRCDGSPDPTVQGEINAYINRQREVMTNNNVPDVLQQVNDTLELIDELDAATSEPGNAEELSDKDRERYKQTTMDLQKLVKHKLDAATFETLKRSSELMSAETLNLQTTYSNDKVKLSLWGNLSKNPRIKTFEFPEEQVAFDIPKILTLSDCVYRYMHVKFDHLSHLSKSHVARKKEKDVAQLEIQDLTEEKPVEDTRTEDAPKEPTADEDDIGREKTEDIMALLRGEEPKKEEKAKEPEKVEPEILDRELASSPVPDEWEDFDGDDEAVDLRAFSPVGGVVYFNLLEMPPQPRQAKSWTITKLADPADISYIDYIADDVNPAAQLAKQKAAQEDDPGTKREERPPIAVQMKLPADVYFFEEPQMARWDDKRHLWRVDGFQDVHFVEETRRLTFKTSYFGTLALMQDIHINMPFQSWELRPKGLNHCLLTIIAAIVELEIEVKDTLCVLRQPSNRTEVAHLKDKWMPLSMLKKALVATGINIFPNEDSAKYVTVQDKNPVLEKRIYQQMALTASSMAYSWSKWNGETKDKNRLIVQASEQLKDEPLTEDEWSIFMLTRKWFGETTVIKLKVSEFDEAFSDEAAEGVQPHADMLHMSLDIAMDEGKDRIHKTDCFFIDTVNELLSSTRLLAYS